MNERIQLHWFLGGGRGGPARRAAHDRQRPRADHCSVALSSPQRGVRTGRNSQRAPLRRFSVLDTPVERTPRLPTIAPVHPALLLPRRQRHGPESLDEYRARGGYEGLKRARTGSPAALRAAIAESRLRGRGGAAFPTARKWELAANAPAAEKFVVANGGEHEPGSKKDRFLVEQHPHAVLEGLLLAGFATGAVQGWLYLIEDMHDAKASARAALQELRDAGLLLFPI